MAPLKPWALPQEILRAREGEVVVPKGKWAITTEEKAYQKRINDEATKQRKTVAKKEADELRAQKKIAGTTRRTRTKKAPRAGNTGYPAMPATPVPHVAQSSPPQGPLPQGPLAQGPVPQSPLPQGPPPQYTQPQGPLFQGPLIQGPLIQGPLLQAPLPQAQPQLNTGSTSRDHNNFGGDGPVTIGGSGPVALQAQPQVNNFEGSGPVAFEAQPQVNNFGGSGPVTMRASPQVNSEGSIHGAHFNSNMQLGSGPAHINFEPHTHFHLPGSGPNYYAGDHVDSATSIDLYTYNAQYPDEKTDSELRSLLFGESASKATLTANPLDNHYHTPPGLPSSDLSTLDPAITAKYPDEEFDFNARSPLFGESASGTVAPRVIHYHTPPDWPSPKSSSPEPSLPDSPLFKFNMPRSAGSTVTTDATRLENGLAWEWGLRSDLSLD